MEDDDGISIAALLLEMDADLPEPDDSVFLGGAVPRSASNLSELSLASSASTMLAPSTSYSNLLDVKSPTVSLIPSASSTKQLLLIEVFCTFNGWIVHIEYPSTENGWSYRADLGGHAHHRWEYSNLMILIARHSTCGRSVFPNRELCRNCFMKQIWRAACIDPCNTFYLQAMNTVQACVDMLRPMVYEASEAGETTAALYRQHVPKPTVSRKRVVDPDAKRARMLKLEAALRESVMQSQGEQPVVVSEQQSFLAALGYALDKKDASNSLPSEQSMLPDMGYFAAVAPAPPPLLPTTAIVVSPQRLLASHVCPPPGLQSDVTLNCVVVPQPMPPPSVIGHNAPLAHKEFMELLQIDDKFEVSLSKTVLESFISTHPTMSTSFAMLGSSADLNRIACQLSGLQKSCQMLVKSVLSDWIGEVLKLALDGSVVIRVGFYSAPSVAVYTELYKSETLPRFVVNATHRIEHDYKAALVRAHGLVLIVAFYGGVFPMVPGSHMVPLGVVHH